jgi:hypothetical protein
MKYVLENSQVSSLIYKFIDDEFYEDNLDWGYNVNYDTDILEKNIINFFGDKYNNNDQDDWYFQYVKKEYYTNLETNEDNRVVKEWSPKAPLLEFLDVEFTSKMNSMFANFWKPSFEKWFSKKYPTFPVKTFIYHT